MRALSLAAAFLSAASLPLTSLAYTGGPQFGHDLLQHFLLAENYTNLNHGSYGAPPRAVLDAHHAWQLKMEQNPDHWFRYDGPGTLLTELDKVRERLAKMINAAAGKDIAFVDNASGGMNAVLRSLRLPPTSKVLYLNTIYLMVKNTIDYVGSHDKQESSVEVNLTSLDDTADIVARVRAVIEADHSIRLASFSHITSHPAVILPVKELTKLCHEHGIPFFTRQTMEPTRINFLFATGAQICALAMLAGPACEH
eukprot:TRINITY_DN22512_c0_g1_i3.p1 TRINITY_DN22512_c0_g1~~TRINITY_DN22512_c0_g1_i3.p1  ORF type:complete len:254 (-),score=34.89 TRINITY_DN22512_c0_g1_i3:189-950(-)